MDRRFYIGSGGCAAILGLGDHTARLLYWKEKGPQGIQKELSNVHVRRGNFTEPLLMAWVRDHVDPTVAEPARYIEHDFETQEEVVRAEREAEWSFDAQQRPIQFARQKIARGEQIFVLDRKTLDRNGSPYIGGHPDDLGADTVYEYKAPAMRNVDRVKREGLPSTWFYQVQHNMMLTGLPHGCVMLWDYDEWCPYVFRFDADPNLHAIMREEYEAFWESVLDGVPPQPRTPRMAEHWTVCSDADLGAMIAGYREATDAYYAAERKKKDLKGKILTFAQGRSKIITPTHVATIKEITTKTGGYTKITVSENDEPIAV